MKMIYTYVNLFYLPCSHIRHLGKNLRIYIPVLIITFFSFLNSITVNAQCNGAPDLAFTNPVLESGIDGQPGAIYRFGNVTTGIDATIEIMGLYGGALLGEIDNTTQGYFDAWQPYVTAGANDTSYLEWRITFKQAGTNIDTALPCLAITAVDVDGDGSDLKEFIQAATPGAYAVDPATTLTITFDGVYNRAIGSVVTIPLIDTFHTEAMFQMNFANLSSIIYRNGSISTKDDIDVRHTCIYFKPFFYNEFITLPVQLLSFNAGRLTNATSINWTVTNEKKLSHYIVQKSSDGISWQDFKTVSAVNIGNGVHTYYCTDFEQAAGKTYYRLKEIHLNNNLTFSHTIYTVNQLTEGLTIKTPTLVKKQLSIQVQTTTANNLTIRLLTLQGQLISHAKTDVQPGSSTLNVAIPAASGIYILSITDRQGLPVHSSKIINR